MLEELLNVTQTGFIVAYWNLLCFSTRFPSVSPVSFCLSEAKSPTNAQYSLTYKYKPVKVNKMPQQHLTLWIITSAIKTGLWNILANIFGPYWMALWTNVIEYWRYIWHIVTELKKSKIIQYYGWKLSNIMAFILKLRQLYIVYVSVQIYMSFIISACKLCYCHLQ